MDTLNKKKINILIIEDSEPDLILLIRELKKGDFTFKHKAVDNLNDFNNELKQDIYNLIISDFNLQGFDAFDILAELKSKKITIPVIVSSGTVNKEKCEQLINEGAKECVLKNNLKQIHTIVDKLVS